MNDLWLLDRIRVLALEGLHVSVDCDGAAKACAAIVTLIDATDRAPQWSLDRRLQHSRLMRDRLTREQYDDSRSLFDDLEGGGKRGMTTHHRATRRSAEAVQDLDGKDTARP